MIDCIGSIVRAFVLYLRLELEPEMVHGDVIDKDSICWSSFQQSLLSSRSSQDRRQDAKTVCTIFASQDGFASIPPATLVAMYQPCISHVLAKTVCSHVLAMQVRAKHRARPEHWIPSLLNVLFLFLKKFTCDKDNSIHFYNLDVRLYV